MERQKILLVHHMIQHDIVYFSYLTDDRTLLKKPSTSRGQQYSVKPIRGKIMSRKMPLMKGNEMIFIMVL